MKKMLYLMAMTATLTLNLTACQQGFSQNELEKHIALNKISKEAEIERELDIIQITENSRRNEINGENIPEVFKTISLPERNLLDLLDYSDAKQDGPYINFVKELKINCDGTITYSKNYGGESTISWDMFLFSPRWRAEDLTICGKLEVPEGQKLIILSTRSTRLQNIQFTTQKNSLLGLILKNTQYDGAAPALNVHAESILKFKFE